MEGKGHKTVGKYQKIKNLMECKKCPSLQYLREMEATLQFTKLASSKQHDFSAQTGKLFPDSTLLEKT